MLDAVLLQACLNGARTADEHAALPLTSGQIALAAAAVVAEGAGSLHVHPKDADGLDTLDPGFVADVVGEIRAVAPGVPVGVTTGAWAVDSPEQRLELIRRWRVLPDFASVNWHEDGAVATAAQLLQRGVQVEAGLWDEAAVRSWLAWPARGRCCRVLLEVLPRGDDPVARARRLLDVLGGPGIPVLLHGEGPSCWPLLDEAARLGLDTRVGLEDVLDLPDGTPALDNCELVVAARRRIEDVVLR